MSIYDEDFSEYIGEMHTVDSEQYGTGCVVVFNESADDVIAHCRMMEAIYYEDNTELFVVDLRRGVGPELYTERALRKSLERCERGSDCCGKCHQVV